MPKRPWRDVSRVTPASCKIALSKMGQKNCQKVLAYPVHRGPRLLFWPSGEGGLPGPFEVRTERAIAGVDIARQVAMVMSFTLRFGGTSAGVQIAISSP